MHSRNAWYNATSWVYVWCGDPPPIMSNGPYYILYLPFQNLCSTDEGRMAQTFRKYIGKDIGTVSQLHSNQI